MLKKGILVLLLVELLAATTVKAVTPSIWKDNTQSEFVQGEPKNVSITSEGEILLAPAFQEITDTGEPYIWCINEDKKGNLYLGTGNSGKIFRIDPKGRKTLFFDSPEVGIHCLVTDKKGNIYAGSSPDGLIYKVTPEGAASTFCVTGEKYVWSLAMDNQGYLYAGTGEKARILKISPKGDVKELYASTENHIISLVCTPEGTVYAGSEGSGIVYKINQRGKALALYDAREKEIHSLLLTPEGDLYAGAMSGTVSQKQSQPSLPPPPEGSTLYKISDSGTVWPLWHCSDPLLLSLVSDSQGNLIVGTGEKGTIYSVTPEGKWTMLLKLPFSQPISLYRNRQGKIFVGTEGKLYQIMPHYAKKGSLISRERDMSVNSKWGKIRWEAELPAKTEVTLQTRSGNTQHADNTWSDWSKELKDPNGSQITSPPARFLQYRVNLFTSNQSVTPVVREVAFVSLPSNLRPQIKAVTISPYFGPAEGGPPAPGPESQQESPPQGEEMPGEPPPKRVPQKGLWRISWTAWDPNNDNLVYDLYFRGSGEKDWKLLKKGLHRTSYVWNTTSCPDGVQLVKVVASDRPANPPGLALSTEKVSKPFLVDNTPPMVGPLNIKQLPDYRIRVEGELKDAASPLKKAEYSIDSGEWVVFFPKDGIFDSERENFRFHTEPLSPGEHTLVVRVADSQNNIGTGKAVVEIKRTK